MDTIFKIDRSVHHIKKGLLETKPLAEKLEASIAAHLRSHCDLPAGYSIVLHNTEPIVNFIKIETIFMKFTIGVLRRQHQATNSNLPQKT